MMDVIYPPHGVSSAEDEGLEPSSPKGGGFQDR